MSSVTLLLGIHNHQPVGNFEHVFRIAYDKCYRPFLDLLERHPKIRLSLHYTGPLLDWFEKEEPRFLDRLRVLVQSGQVEMLGGGYYEPILSVIPEQDAVGQINLLSQRLRGRMGADPKGFWLAERVWDGGLPKKVAPTGLRYTILDDSHFMHAGFDPETLNGYYLTEREGAPLGLFPISKDLRYLIPFRVPEDLMAFLSKFRESETKRAVTYADDGEKFGLWPDTYRWVYDDGYLERLFTLLEQNASWLTLQTFGEYFDTHHPAGRMYLPSASYDEMMEWALPVESSHALMERKAELEREGRLAAFRPFLRGGFWDEFFVKYPEANHLHKRMLDVSCRIANAGSEGGIAEAREWLWKAQGNDVYWHGLFGGLYLGNLRHETYRNLLMAETLLDRRAHDATPGKVAPSDWIDVRLFDLDKDGSAEVLVSTSTLGLCVAPDCGGGVIELDYRPAKFNLLNVLTRRPEAYHHKLTDAAVETSGEGGTPKSIHDIVKVKEPGLDRLLIYDRHRRLSMLDRFLPADASWEALDLIDDVDRGNCVGGRYRLDSSTPLTAHGVVALPLTFPAIIRMEHRTVPVGVRKEYRLSSKEESLAVSYALDNQSQEPCRVRFGIELNLTLLAGDDPQRYYEWEGSPQVRLKERGQCQEVTWFALVDVWHRFRVTLRFEQPGDVWYLPIETVSQSEDGFERTYQGSAILMSWVMTLGPGKIERPGIRIELSDL